MTAEHEEIEAAMQAAMAGMNPRGLLASTDEFEVAIMQAVAYRVAEQRQIEREILSNMIANEVARRFGGS